MMHNLFANPDISFQSGSRERYKPSPVGSRDAAREKFGYFAF